MRRSRILQALLLVLPTTLVHAQQCLDFAPTSSNATLGCDCPPGLGGKTCQDLTCGNPILSPASRSVVNSTAGRNGCNTAGGCTTGFGGVNCNVCQSAQACSAAIAASPSSSRTTSAAIPSGTSLGSGITAGGTDNVVCNNSPYTYTEGFISCDVVNPTLQAVFAGTTYLSIQKAQNPSLSLSSAYGSNATALAQLWYSPNSSSVPIQQFYCAADSCTQKNDTSSNQVQETCSNLSCRCIPGTAFCGGSVLDLTTTINGLSGTLEVDCENGSGGNCYFKQSILQSLFGQNGLALSSCQFGECVLQSVMNALAPASAVNASNGLSGGVIAGLAVLGVIVFILACLIGIGYINQSRARKSFHVVPGPGEPINCNTDETM